MQDRLVFLTSHLPRKGSEGYVALKQVYEQGGFFDAIEMRSAEGYDPSVILDLDYTVLMPR